MNNRLFYTIAVLLITISIAFWIYMFMSPANTITDESTMEYYNDEIALTMYYGEGCMCCMRWGDYLKNHGVNVETVRLDNPLEFKEEAGVPPSLRSCHTAIVDGYVVEGHVPIEDIQRLLMERPDAIGISAPGMPASAPGMDSPISTEYEIILFDESNNMSVFSQY